MQRVHHVYVRGTERERLFRDDHDRHEYLSNLARVTIRLRWRLLAFCLMPNHLHLVVETRKPNLGNGLQRLHSSYAHAFNGRHRHTGHAFAGRYGSRLVAGDEQLWATLAYIAHDPVRGGLCSAPEGHPWSSHALIARQRAPRWLDERRLRERLEGAPAALSPDSSRRPEPPRRAPASSPR